MLITFGASKHRSTQVDEPVRGRVGRNRQGEGEMCLVASSKNTGLEDKVAEHNKKGTPQKSTRARGAAEPTVAPCPALTWPTAKR